MTKKTASTSVEKSPSRVENGKWILRDAKSGKSSVVRTTIKSRATIKKAASANTGLLNRLAKR